MSLNRINFFRLDPVKIDAIRKTSSIVNYVLNKLECLEQLAECMKVVTHYENWPKRFNEWKINYNCDVELKDLLEDMFNSLKNSTVFSDVRGVLLERITEELGELPPLTFH
jgi:hypothetical protein